MTIVESIREYLHDCPYMKKIWPNVNFLDKLTTSYSIEAVPAEKTMKRYADGGELRQYVFVLASRRNYSKNVTENLENSAFSEKFAAWLEEQNAQGNLPKLQNGEAQRIETLDNGFYFVDETSTTANYQIHCRLIYYVKG